MRGLNLKPFVLTSFCVFSLVISSQLAVAEKKEFTYKDEKAVSDAMRMVQINTENLLIAFDKMDWNQMETLAMAIHDACMGLESYGNADVPVEFDDFRLLNENLHDYAEAIVTASKEHKIDKAKVAYKDMEKTCLDCHRKFRN